MVEEKLKVDPKGFADKILRPNSRLAENSVYYFLLYSDIPKTEICSIVGHMTPANWGASTDGLSSKVQTCMLRLMSRVVYVCIPAQAWPWATIEFIEHIADSYPWHIAAVRLLHLTDFRTNSCNSLLLFDQFLVSFKNFGFSEII